MDKRSTGAKTLKLFAASVAGFMLAITIARVERVRVITTDSAAPAGIYRMICLPPTRDTLVLACLPLASARLAMARGYLGAGDCPAGAEPVAKIVGALPGDTVDIESDAVAVNGVRIPHSPTVARDTMGRPLEHVAWGRHRVLFGETWLFGFNNPHSWDGRYFGAIPISNLLGRITPILTW
jgi:conjugative transfer signal peptidase TraF